MARENYDLIVFGGGNSLDVVRGAAEAGLRVAVIEKGPLGGTCPNSGCIPSKLLLAHADAATAVREAGRFHVDAELRGVDGAAILQETFAYTRGFDARVEKALPDGVTVHRGHGRFTGPRSVEVDGTGISADRLVLATGSRPRTLDLGVGEWTSDDLWTLDEPPASLTIVGGGYIGTEMAHFFHGIGVDVLLVARGGDLLSREDEETGAAFQEAFTARVPTRLHSELVEATRSGGRIRMVFGQEGHGRWEHESEALLLAVGRVPNSDRLDIERSGLELDKRGFVRTDDCLRTNVDGVWAMGDVAGRHMFTHAASHEAKYLARVVTGREDGPLEYGPMPHAVFTHPEVAGVGRTERDLADAGVEYHKAVVHFGSVTKGRALKADHGLCKLLVAPSGEILGCHLTGPHASILLHEVLPVMRWRNDVRSLTGFIHVHPSLPEVVGGAAGKALAAIEG